MGIEKDKSLLPYNSFHIEARAEHFVSITNEDQLKEILEKEAGKAILVLGGGSNILFTKDVKGWVLKMDIGGIEEIKEDEQHVYVRAGAGENWHSFVLYSISRNWAGLENLSLIPGNVGAAPIQNIGAYGVELKDVFYELQAYDRKNRKVYTFGLNDCAFGYRDSFFKSAEKNRYIILNVTFVLNKVPVLNTSYGAIRAELEQMEVRTPSIRSVSQAVINIRKSKLPDPAEIGNAGSFFKNPVVDQQLFLSLSKAFPDMPAYPHEEGSVKLAAGWLIEQCGWKGYRKGDAGVHQLQSLVLVNYGHATGKEIFDLGEAVAGSVKKKFGVVLEREVNVW
ncbi:MAG: UDP-N-acetylmuramate dehydrogenase [Bacteroidota bacterium]|nr:UDP-N-acetylmuramate dehydrogenase [Bacteroidota bacterium]